MKLQKKHLLKILTIIPIAALLVAGLAFLLGGLFLNYAILWIFAPVASSALTATFFVFLAPEFPKRNIYFSLLFQIIIILLMYSFWFNINKVYINSITF